MRYLIVKTSAFGDIIHTYKALEYLKQIDPSCQIDWVVESRMATLVKSHPLISKCIEIDTKGWRKDFISSATRKEIAKSLKTLREEKYDALFDFQGNIKSALITFFARANDKVGFGTKTASELIATIFYTKRFDPPLGLKVSDENFFLVKSYFKIEAEPRSARLLFLNEKLPVYKPGWLIAPGSNWKNKQLTKETMIAFLDRCTHSYNNPHLIFLCGTPKEKEQAEEFVLHFPGSEILYKPSLSLLQHIMSRMEIVISMDSLPLHLAATAGCKTFSFFGPSSSQKYNPLGIIHGTFQGSCPYGETFDRRCKKLRTCPTGACLRNQSVDTLFSSFQTWFRANS